MSENWNTLRTQIEYFAKPFPRAAIAFANAHRDEVAPFLIESLVRVANHPSGVEDDYVLHLYAMHLLAMWRDTRAYEPLATLGHHAEEVLETLMGDTVTETYGRCLASVCDGNMQPLRALFEDSQASHWSRDAALNGWKVRVLEGDAPRAELLHYLIACGDAEASRLRLSDSGRSGLEVLNSIVSVAADIGAVEMMERIDGWFDDNLLDTSIADKKWVQDKIAVAFDQGGDCQPGLGRGYVRSVEKEMSWWCGFEDEPIVTQTRSQGPQPLRYGPKIGRNERCPCGSGKKYKKCHGG